MSEETLGSVEKKYIYLFYIIFLLKACFQNKNTPSECLKELTTGAAWQLLL